MSEVVAVSSVDLPTRTPVFGRSIGIDTLPTELLTQVLRNLSTSSLRRASGVSRRFYASSWEAGLYIERHIVWEWPKSCEEQIAAVQDLVQHALPKNLRLKLCVLIWNAAVARVSSSDDKRQWRDILSAVACALPLLIYLELAMNDFDDHVAAALCHPAPRLHELVLSRSSSKLKNEFTLPLELFAGQAPLLRRIRLHEIHLPAALVPVFKVVTSLCLSQRGHFKRVPLVRDFPRLSELELDAAPMELPPCLFDGLRLRSLTVRGGITAPQALHAVDVDKIPILQFACDDILWIEPESDCAVDFSLRIGNLNRNADTSAVVVPAHQRWRRTYDIWMWVPNTRLPSIADKPGGGPAHLTYLRVESTFLHGFLSCNIPFPALRALKVDFNSETEHPATVWPPDMLRPPNGLVFAAEDKTSENFDGRIPYCVPCNALKEIVLFALDETITIPSREVAFLGRALGQVVKEKAAKAALDLVGVEFAKPEARLLLEKTFSAVRHRSFSGRDSKEDDDAGLWVNVV